MEGYTGDIRWWPKHFDISSKFSKLEDQSLLQKDLEDSIANADWLSAARAHERLASLARKHSRFEEALDHIEAALDVYGDINNGLEDLGELEEQRRQWMSLVELFREGSELDRNIMVGNHNAALNTFESMQENLKIIPLNEEGQSLLCEYREYFHFMATLKGEKSVIVSESSEDLDRRLRDTSISLADLEKREGRQARLDMTLRDMMKAIQTMVTALTDLDFITAWHAAQEKMSITEQLAIRPAKPEQKSMLYQTLLVIGLAANEQAITDRKWDEAAEISSAALEIVENHESDIKDVTQARATLRYNQTLAFNEMFDDGNKMISKACTENKWQEAIDACESIVRYAEKVICDSHLDAIQNGAMIAYFETKRDLKSLDTLRLEACAEERYLESLQYGEQQVTLMDKFSEKPETKQAGTSDMFEEARDFVLMEIQVLKINYHNSEGIKAERFENYDEALSHLNELEKIHGQQNNSTGPGYRGRLPVSYPNIMISRFRIAFKIELQRIADEQRIAEESND